MQADRVRLDGEKLRRLRKELWRTRKALEAHIKEKNRATGDTVSEETIGNAEESKPILCNSAKLIADALQTPLGDLIMERVPIHSFLDGQAETQEDLLQDSFRAYVHLFPNERERDKPADIRRWLEDAHLADVNKSRWREVYGVLHVDSTAIGMAYLSGHADREFWFGNYFGVLQGWPRQDDRATDFLKNKIVPRLARIIPATKAILFEIEPIDQKYLKRVAKRSRLAGHGDEKRLCYNLDAVARLEFYTIRHAFAFLQTDGTPMPYWQPAMTRRLERRFEQPLILMVYPFNGSANRIDKTKAIDFIYDDLYTNAYDGSSGVELPDYTAYVQTVKARVTPNLPDCAIKPFSLDPDIRGLLPRAKSEGLWRRRSAD